MAENQLDATVVIEFYKRELAKANEEKILLQAQLHEARKGAKDDGRAET